MAAATNVVNDCCPVDQLCDRCVDDGFAQLRGVAQSRGYFWAVDLEASGVRGRWPDASDRMLMIAIAKVADLTRDERLRARLAEEAIRAGRRRWASCPSPAP